MSWISLHEVNKNNTKTYITKTVLVTKYPTQESLILPIPEEITVASYKTPIDAYNLIATDLNEMKNFTSYRLMVPEENIGSCEFVAHDLEDDCTKTYIYKIHHPEYQKRRLFHTTIRIHFLYKYFNTE